MSHKEPSLVPVMTGRDEMGARWESKGGGVCIWLYTYICVCMYMHMYVCMDGWMDMYMANQQIMADLHCGMATTNTTFNFIFNF